MSRKGERTRLRNRSRYGLLLTLGAAALAALAVFGAGGPAGAANGGGKGVWQRVEGKPGPARKGAKPAVNPRSFDALRLDRAGIADFLAAAPTEHALTKRDSGLVISLPDPTGSVPARSSSRSPTSWRRGSPTCIPTSTTYSGRGIDDPSATIHADLSRSASTPRSARTDGAWYIDPYYHLDHSLYASYYGRDVRASHRGLRRARRGRRRALRRPRLLPRDGHGHGPAAAASRRTPRSRSRSPTRGALRRRAR